MKLAKDTALYEECERMATPLKNQGKSWSQVHSATAVVRAVLAETLDELAKRMNEASKAGTPRDWTDVFSELSSEDSGKEWRTRLIATARPFFTASKNVQSNILADTGLMDKPSAAGEDANDYA